ncbi:MAG: bifunctional 4-hydroxy-2-oxoglutarate aldolase/2-dehydro-3-deoxy-phosphogluconate aldolase [Acidobacteria bacterium]|nr:bifunctional 4-hydroxy-2-oxoglutarate aldolase/2-dehydro-3-deoxy-phosphogluconate aldolase [Acidobacteriota bacterium]MCK6681534.1 bifunctional 4-hydroxy-2-oxoglutarate aldolase/2-dehydro-3-deoxy-phosphogluconate aldolase [Thermoanaerobaculia bacterium]
MSTRAETVSAIQASGVVAVIRMKEPAALRSVIDALALGGVFALEVTMTVPGAVGLIRELAPSLPPEIILGAGTVLDAETARAVVEAGARYVVSPVFKEDVLRQTQRLGAAAMPGCFTPTEILTAWEAGADIVKVFPATALGPSYFRDLRGPLPHLKLMPTGGVSLSNAGEWIRAGAAAIGVGTALVDTAAIAAGRFSEITARARQFVDAVQEARMGR